MEEPAEARGGEAVSGRPGPCAQACRWGRGGWPHQSHTRPHVRQERFYGKEDEEGGMSGVDNCRTNSSLQN